MSEVVALIGNQAFLSFHGFTPTKRAGDLLSHVSQSEGAILPARWLEGEVRPRFEARRVKKSSCDAAAAHKADQEQHQGDHEQDVNERAYCVTAHESKQPQDQQNDGDGL